MVATSTAQNTSEPEESDSANTAEMTNSKKFHRSSEKRVPEHLGTTRMLPEHGGGPKVAGEVLAAEDLAGAEEDNTGKMF